MRDPKSYDLAMAVVAWLGFHQGLLPFLARLFGWHPSITLALRLSAPWWWLVAGGTLLVALGALAALDGLKTRRCTKPAAAERS